MAVRINVETCSSKSYVIKSINNVQSLVELYIIKMHGTGVNLKTQHLSYMLICYGCGTWSGGRTFTVQTNG